MKVDSNGNPNTEPYLYTCNDTAEVEGSAYAGKYKLTLKAAPYAGDTIPTTNDIVLVDYYVEKDSGAF
jgi:hypothetical protein